MIYLSIDAGVGTGIARWDTEDPEHIWMTELYDMDEVTDTVRHCVSEEEQTGKGLTVIDEKFVVDKGTGRTKFFYETIWFNGWLALEYPGLAHQQVAAVADLKNKRGTHAKLKHLGWWMKTKDMHAVSATSHLLYRVTMPGQQEPYVINKLKEMIDD